MTSIASRLSDLVSDVFLTTVCITEITELSASFVRIQFGDEGFRRTQWTPGDKLQIRPRRGSLQMRTYTPIGWDHDEGLTEVIVYRHGDGPGARWADGVAVGDDCEVFGPSRSLELSGAGTPTIFVGDETSIGLAHALHPANQVIRYVYEAADPDGVADVLAALGLADQAEIVAKSDDRGDLLRRIRHADEAVAGPRDLIVSGDAATVNAIRRETRRWQPPAPRITARAYWARGRAGLD